MSKMIQIRNVPDELHRKLKAKAAAEGVSLSELMLRQAERTAGGMSLNEFLRMMDKRPRTNKKLPIVEIIRAHRDRP